MLFFNHRTSLLFIGVLIKPNDNAFPYGFLLVCFVAVHFTMNQIKKFYRTCKKPIDISNGTVYYHLTVPLNYFLGGFLNEL